MELYNDRTWVGAGAKIGGELVVAGAETFEGVATRLDNWSTAWHEINVTSIRLGLGLGGSVGVSLFFGYNIGMLWEVNNSAVSDWGINIAVPEFKVQLGTLSRTIDFAKYIDGAEFLSRPFIDGMSPDKIAKMRDMAALIYNMGDLGSDGTPKLVVLDIPVGWGAEVAAFVTTGEFTVGAALGAPVG